MHHFTRSLGCGSLGIWLSIGSISYAAKAEVVRFTTSDGVEIVGDFYEPDDLAKPAPVAILVHMYLSDRSAWKPLVGALGQAGFAVLAIDLRGHGDSGGESGESLATRARRRDPSLFRAMYLDVAAAHTWLGRRPSCDLSRVAIIGASVGCSVAIDCASRDRSIDAVVALTPGLDYLGMDSTKPIVACGDRSILLLATEEEREATDKLGKLNPAVTSEIVGPGRIHGTHMFGRIVGIELKIANFLKNIVGGRATSPVVSLLGSSRYYRNTATLTDAPGMKKAQLRWYSSAREAEARGLKPANP